MGVHADAIADLISTHGLPDALPFIRAYKASAHVTTNGSGLPKTINWSGGRKCTVNSVELVNDTVVLDVEFSTGPTVHPFSNPWVLVNPPMVHNGVEDLIIVFRQIAEQMHTRVSA